MKQSLLVTLLGIAGFLVLAAWGGATFSPDVEAGPYFSGLAVGLGLGSLAVMACVLYGEG